MDDSGDDLIYKFTDQSYKFKKLNHLKQFKGVHRRVLLVLVKDPNNDVVVAGAVVKKVVKTDEQLTAIKTN